MYLVNLLISIQTMGASFLCPNKNEKKSKQKKELLITPHFFVFFVS